MEQKELKRSLKDAKEAIKNKDYITALRLCKAVLKEDRNNYVALVLFGAALQETEHKDQAPNAFKKACEISPDQPLAWQGLVSYYEKNNTDGSSDSCNDLLKSYYHLLCIENDSAKKESLAVKLAEMANKIQNYQICCDVLSSLPEDPEVASSLRRIMVTTLIQFKDLNRESAALLEENLHAVITKWKILPKNCDSAMQEIYRRYLRYLNRIGKKKELIEEATIMAEKFPEDPYPLEWLGKIWFESVTEEQDVSTLKKCVRSVIERLDALLPTSSILPSATAALHYCEDEFLQAREDLQIAISSKQAPLHVYLLSVKIELRLYCYCEAIERLKEAKEKLCQVTKDQLHNLTSVTLCLEAIALSHIQREDALKEALNLCEKLLLKPVKDKETLHLAAARALVNMNRFEEAHFHLSECGSSSKATLLETQTLLRSGNTDKATFILESISADSRDAEVWLELARLRDTAGMQAETLTALMEAARCDPFCWITFSLLGDHFKKLKTQPSLDKARRCYQKVLQLNPKSEEVPEKLSDVLYLLGDVISNKQLLELMTKSRGQKWSWLRLGLLHTESGDNEQAIWSLCNAVRCDPSDSRIWESLGDAYVQREAWHAALKSYQKVSQLNPDSIYCAYQIGVVKLRMGDYEEALVSFRDLVSKSPDYVPALQGKGEAAYCWAEVLRNDQRLGFARDRLQEAVDSFTRVLSHRRDLSCTWKLLGDVCVLGARLPTSYCGFHIAEWLVHSSEDQGELGDKTTLLAKEEIFALAVRLYCRAMPASLDSSLLWHDTAAAYFWHASAVGAPSRRGQLLQRSLSAARRAVTINPNNGSHWNLLGVVAASEEVKQRALAQHALIQALRLDAGNAVAWMNLGTLYLILGEIKLANKSFSAAQRADHDLTNSWVGQAMVAEILAHHDTMDLFRHAASLEYHRESCIGYAHWVLSTFLKYEKNPKMDIKDNTVKDMERMNAVAVAADCMQWYTMRHASDFRGWNMLGLLWERQGLYRSAQGAMKHALEEALLLNCDTESLDAIYCNHGRVLTSLQLYEDAIQIFQKVKKASFASQSGRALALYKAQKFEEAYEAYSCSLEWLAPDVETKAQILLAMAAMQYSFNQLEDCKTLLFQSIHPKPLSAHPLLALCAIGLLHNDLNMSRVMLKELKSFKDDPQFLAHIGLLEAFTFFLQGEQKRALGALGQAVHRHPGEGALWLHLAQVQMHAYPACDVHATGRCAHAALLLGRAHMDISKVQSLVCVAELLSGSHSSAVFSSQKAVHQFPNVAENWSALVASLLQPLPQPLPARAAWLRDVVGHVRRRLQPSSAGLRKWLSSHEHHLTSIASG